MLFILLSIIQIPLSYNWIVSYPNRSSPEISSDVLLKIALYMEMRYTSIVQLAGLMMDFGCRG